MFFLDHVMKLYWSHITTILIHYASKTSLKLNKVQQSHEYFRFLSLSQVVLYFSVVVQITLNYEICKKKYDTR